MSLNYLQHLFGWKTLSAKLQSSRIANHITFCNGISLVAKKSVIK